MRPLRSFLLLLIFLACFTGLHYFIPASQFFPAITEFIPTVLINRFSSFDPGDSVELSEYEPDSPTSISEGIISSPDSVPQADWNYHGDPIQEFMDSLHNSNGQVRIMYYGDSQIEGDRITSNLRMNLRKINNGTGPGLFLPLMPVMYTKTIWLKSSSNWKKYNYLSYKNGEISHRALGPFMAVCRFIPEGEKANVIQKAYVRIRPSSFADTSALFFDNLRIFYSSREGSVNVVVKAGDNQVFADSLKKESGLNEINCRLNGSKDVLIEFTGKVSPDIYGISIESSRGLIVDNIPQRGSAGLEFTMVDRENLIESYSKLHPDLIVLHYGLNIVKNVRDDYSYYRRGLERQIKLLKEVSPKSKILIISLTDMAVKEGDSIKSYKNIPVILDAQKSAALESGAAFWDSYKAMGGNSSIKVWSEKKPALAQNDYVHFTYPGADTLSSLLIRSLFVLKTKDTTGLAKLPSEIHSVLPLNSEPLISNPEVTKDFTENLLTAVFKYDQNNPLIFSTASFWVFFLIVLVGYSLIYKKLFVRNFYLFLISLFFYYKSGGILLFLLLFVTLIDFTSGLLIHRARSKYLRRLILLFSIFSNIGILAYFKYTGFFVNTLNDLLGSDYKVYDYLASFSNFQFGTSFNISEIILPVGVSFFTFQSLSYTFDVYRKRIEPVRNVVDFGFYVSFFPQLVAGPIVRASEFIPQLYNEFHLSKREFSHALFLISKGLIKKIIISDFIATNFIDRVFDAPSVYSGFENLMAVYGYGLQIYCDFSGYTDIAIGVALILGFRLPVNFNSPYKASSLTDFWKRWHISLSRWLKDYLYIPLGGNRKGRIRTNINLIITMLLGGLWHGADIRFIIWGFLHGIGLVFNRIWNSIFGEKERAGFFGRAVAVFITFNFVSFCWIFFRAPDMMSIKLMLKQIVESFSPGSYMTVIPAYSSVFLLMAVGYIIHFLPEKFKESYRGLFIRIPLIGQLAIVMVVAILLFQMRSTDTMPFIYFRF
jgi:D-alanyl-lipoteichoic acid acyltransferase DltB (MBOAT superfamily)